MPAKGLYRFLQTKSLRSILIFSFIFVSAIPIIFLQIVSYRRMALNFEDNINRLSQINVNQTRNNLEQILSSYEDVLYQLYTDDNLILSLKEIDTDAELIPLNMPNMRNTLRSMIYAKEEVESITIISRGGNIIFYDRISGSYTDSSWLGENGLAEQSVYDVGIEDFQTKIIPTHEVRDRTESHYLFHLTHRMIDYRNINEEIGVVVLTINENLLCAMSNAEATENSFAFIVDDSGLIISHPDKNKIATREAGYDDVQKKNIGVYISDAMRNWKIISVIDQSFFYDESRTQVWRFLFVGIFLLLLTSFIIITVTILLSRSINTVTSAMKQAEDGNLNVSIKANKIFPQEIQTIAKDFNAMMEQTANLVEEIKTVSVKQRDTEIKALEAQINPHFLYNVLDSISWMALEKNEFEISGMIVSLAKILRYSINKSNKIVSLRDETDWLKQYIHLQQIRYKNNFDYIIDVDESLLDMKIHKMILQPFIENAINHGLKNREGKEKNIFHIAIWQEDEICIKIQDNGKGIETELLQKIQRFAEQCFASAVNKNEVAEMEDNKIGMENAMRRIAMYYGEAASVQVDSKLDEGTTVIIKLKREIL
jgi:two-component system sensor histidine kinase YesM